MGNVKQSMVIVAGLAGLMMAVAGCSGQTMSAPGAPQPSSAAPSEGAGTTDAGSTGQSGTGAGHTDSGTTGSGTTSAGNGGGSSKPSTNSSGGTGTPECRTKDLQVTDQAGTTQNASTHTERLVFRDVANRTCFIEGYPGVSFVTAGGGKQIGRGFIRNGGATPRVTLKPGERAHALIAVTFAPNACVPAKAGGYRVIPPDQFSSLSVSKPQYACTETGQADGHVEPIAAGA